MAMVLLILNPTCTLGFRTSFIAGQVELHTHALYTQSGGKGHGCVILPQVEGKTAHNNPIYHMGQVKNCAFYSNTNWKPLYLSFFLLSHFPSLSLFFLSIFSYPTNTRVHIHCKLFKLYG